MASGVQVVRPRNLSGHKSPPESNPTRSLWLAFSQHQRQVLPNYPDIVDNDSYFQPVRSGSVANLNLSQTGASGASPAVVGSGPSGHGGQSSQAVLSRSQRDPPDMSGVPQPHLYPALQPSDPVLQVSPNNGSRPPQTLPSYRQIQTRDINVGVTARIEPQRADTLPDLLHSHVANPVTPTRPNQHRQTRNGERRSRNADSRTRNATRHRTHEASSRTGRHGHRSRTQSTSSLRSDDGMCKEPCVKCFVKLTSFRWVLVILSLLGVCCVVTGIILAALHAVGNSFLVLAIMFIGLGVLLVIVVGVGWKCTPRGHEPLHALFNIGDFRRRRDRHTRRAFRPRDSNWYGGVMYPEFQFRRPPPSYTASMQEYQQQLLLAQQQYMQQSAAAGAGDAAHDASLPNSPPPSYRSRASTIHSGIHLAFPVDPDQPSSRPPTYRSMVGTGGRRTPVRPPLPRDISNDGGRGDCVAGDDALPGGDVSFAGPDVGSVNGASDGGQTLPVPCGSVVPNSSVTVQSVSSSNSVPSNPSNLAGSTGSYSQTQATNTEPSVIPAHNSSVSGNTNISNVGASSNSAIITIGGALPPREDSFDPELQQTLQTFDEITSLAAGSSESPDQCRFPEETESYQTAL